MINRNIEVRVNIDKYQIFYIQQFTEYVITLNAFITSNNNVPDLNSVTESVERNPTPSFKADTHLWPQ